MKKLFFTLIFNLALFASDPLLRVDTHGHEEKINDIIITRDDKIITCSDDKTIRIWNSKTGAEERKILGQIGAGNEGKIYAVALSFDEKFLAVGGYMGGKAGELTVGKGTIRLYDFASGRVIQVLKSHQGVITDLSFDKNGNLYSASADGTVKVWEAPQGIYLLRVSFNSHSQSVTAVQPLKDNTSFVTAGYDNIINLYNGTKVINSYKHTVKLDSIAVSSRYIASSGIGSEILIFDTRLNLLFTIQNPTEPRGLAFSPDGAKLLVGTSALPNKVMVYDTTDRFKEIVSFDQHHNLAKAVSFLDNTTAVSSGGSNNEIIIWNAATSAEKLRMEGKGKSIVRVGIHGNRIGWGNSWAKKSKNEYGPIEKEFDLRTMSLVSDHLTNFNIIDSSGLSHTCGGDNGYADAVLLLPNKIQIIRNSLTGFGHNTYGKWDQYILSGGSDGILNAFDSKGNSIAHFIGHTGEVWNIAIDGDRMISGSADKVLNLWNLNDIHKTDTIITTVAENSIAKNSGLKSGDKILSIDGRTFNSVASLLNYVKPLKTYLFEIKSEGIISAIAIDKNESKFGFTLHQDQTIRPVLSLFIGTDNEWIAWTKEGFFDASAKGAKYLGYHINQGSDKEARFIRFDKLYDSLYRPDLIQKALKGDSLDSYVKEIRFDHLLEENF
ncbi:MAG: PDZ domain-containing protein [Sulfuricurvum sp.]|jgi:WD40 repeat protein|uniref:PDZ domain-containing protein n=1 Tax=Sulfuricurvum sp. TaxID=2025608 RepID=UPI0025FFA2E5|nr:WD40 repeat domain-containing protein [Sulfuricurvum sp.]MCK9372879.1 PDZ domain-containing protein [Sulfuricurvum sp.]